MGQKVWDLHFVDDGIAEMANGKHRSGIVYHIFNSQRAAEDYANQWRRDRVIQCREWDARFLASPFVHDHRQG